MITVSPIPAELCYDIRHIVLREGLPRESCYWEADKMAGVFHLGAWIESRLAGVSTFQPEAYPTNDHPLPGGGVSPQSIQNAYRLRGMAVLPEFRGLGAGGLMLLAGEDRLRRQGLSFVWCHARVGALSFYEKYGWEIVSDLFEIPTAGLHRVMIRDLGKPFACAGC